MLFRSCKNDSDSVETIKFCIFLKNYFEDLKKCGQFLKSLDSVTILLVLCFGFLATKYVGSYLPDQGLILCPLLWKVKS